MTTMLRPQRIGNLPSPPPPLQRQTLSAFVEHTWKLIGAAAKASSFDDGVAANRTMTGRLDYIWTCMMKNSEESSAVAEENNRGERQQPRRFVRQWSTTKINYSTGAVSAAANGTCRLVVSLILSRQGVCTIASLLLKPTTLNGLLNSLGCQQHVTRP